MSRMWWTCSISLSLSFVIPSLSRDLCAVIGLKIPRQARDDSMASQVSWTNLNLLLHAP